MKRALLFLMLVAGPAYAQQSASPAGLTVDIPQKYTLSGPIQESGRESAQAVNGNLYTVVSPIFTGSGGNTSYVRLGNGNALSVTISVTIVGSPSGRVYGVASYTVPPLASIQRSVHDIFTRANVALQLTGGDEVFAFYLRSSQQYLTAFQHVIHNSNTRFFENMSLCTFRSNIDYSGLNQIAINVHTSQALMVDYPATVYFHHYGSSQAGYRADVYVSETGEWKGAFNFTMRANGTVAVPMQWFEEQVGWVPQFGQSHANILFQRSDGGQYQGTAGNAVYNAALDAYINMSQFCGINIG